MKLRPSSLSFFPPKLTWWMGDDEEEWWSLFSAGEKREKESDWKERKARKRYVFLFLSPFFSEKKLDCFISHRLLGETRLAGCYWLSIIFPITKPTHQYRVVGQTYITQTSSESFLCELSSVTDTATLLFFCRPLTQERWRQRTCQGCQEVLFL